VIVCVSAVCKCCRFVACRRVPSLYCTASVVGVLLGFRTGKLDELTRASHGHGTWNLEGRRFLFQTVVVYVFD
jgi:hypothetical protein